MGGLPALGCEAKVEVSPPPYRGPQSSLDHKREKECYQCDAGEHCPEKMRILPPVSHGHPIVLIIFLLRCSPVRINGEELRSKPFHLLVLQPVPVHRLGNEPKKLRACREPPRSR